MTINFDTLKVGDRVDFIGLHFPAVYGAGATVSDVQVRRGALGSLTTIFTLTTDSGKVLELGRATLRGFVTRH